MAQTYYIFRSGRLRRKQNTLYLEQENDDGQVQRQPIPIENVRDLYLFGEIDLNTKLLSFLAQNEIVVHCSTTTASMSAVSTREKAMSAVTCWCGRLSITLTRKSA
jgi:CRISPR-associated protein, Cas1 family